MENCPSILSTGPGNGELSGSIQLHLAIWLFQGGGGAYPAPVWLIWSNVVGFERTPSAPSTARTSRPHGAPIDASPRGVCLVSVGCGGMQQNVGKAAAAGSGPESRSGLVSRPDRTGRPVVRWQWRFWLFSERTPSDAPWRRFSAWVRSFGANWLFRRSTLIVSLARTTKGGTPTAASPAFGGPREIGDRRATTTTTRDRSVS